MILNLINNNYYWHFVTEHLWQTLLSCVHWMWNKMKWNEWHHKMSFVIAIFHSNSIVHKANITTQFYHFFSFDFICIEIFLFSFLLFHCDHYNSSITITIDSDVSEISSTNLNSNQLFFLIYLNKRFFQFSMGLMM